MAAVCRQWSPLGHESFQGLCGMLMRAETGNPTKQCSVCATPLAVAVTCGTSTWGYELAIPGGATWVLTSNDCTGGGTPVTPPGTPANPFDTATTDCDCG